MPEPQEANLERLHLAALARGSAATLAGALVSTVAGFGLVLWVTRTVDPTTAGSFFAVTAVFVVALAAAGLGTDTGLARFVLRYDERGARTLLRAAAVPVLVTASILAAVLALAVPSTRPLVWALPLAAGADLCLAAARAHARFGSTVLVDRLVRPGLQVALVGAVLLIGLPGAALAAAWASAYVVAAALSAGALGSLLRERAGDHREPAAGDDEIDARAYWRFTWPRAVARVAQVSVQKGDIVLVAILTSPADAAVYTVATRFVVFGQLANQAISSVVQPRFTLILTRDGRPDSALLSRVFGVTTSWGVLLAWPVYLAAAAAPVSYLGWFGASYTSSDAVAVVLVMAGGMLIAVASGPVDTLLLMAGRSGWSLANTLTALVLDLALCLVLVPRLGIVGAAVAWVVAVVVRCSLAVVQLRSELRLAPDMGRLVLAGVLPLLCIAAPIGFVGLLVDLTPLTWLLTCVAAGACYASVLWRIRAHLAIDLFVGALAPHREPEAVAA